MPRASILTLGPALALVLGLSSAAAAPRAGGAPLPPEGEGRRLFMKFNCYSCHGMYAGGGMGPSLRGEGGSGGDSGDLREVILHGAEHGMRSFNTYFSSTDLDNMTAYVRSLGSKSEPTFKDWWLDNPPK